MNYIFQTNLNNSQLKALINMGNPLFKEVLIKEAHANHKIGVPNNSFKLKVLLKAHKSL
jgi:hypothetical protein